MSGEVSILQQINSIFEKFDGNIKRLDEIPLKTQRIVNQVRSVALSNFFDSPKKFLDAIDKLSRVMGYVAHTVIEIELIRQKIRRPQELVEEFLKQAESKKAERTEATPIIVQTATQPVGSSPGFWGYLAERKRMATLEKIYVPGNSEPQITTTQKPSDILDYCRDIPRECNRLIDYFQGCIDHLHFFNDVETKEYFYGEIRTYISKLCIIIKSFTQAIVEYRKELVGQRQVKYAEALTALEQARYLVQQSRGAVDRLALEMLKRGE